MMRLPCNMTKYNYQYEKKILFLAKSLQKKQNKL